MLPEPSYYIFVNGKSKVSFIQDIIVNLEFVEVRVEVIGVEIVC